ncbi:MAG TPA: D-alanine--D-alanine ligase [Polyangia bacterium]|jgi:D-alanine-D-alanine ligase
MIMINRKIGVLLGGLSAEREISQRSGEAILRALADRGYDATPIFVDRDVDLILRQKQIDVAFLALAGRYGEDGCIQGLLELLGIPYTGSGVLASGLAMNKAKAKEIFRLHNLPTAPGYLFDGMAERLPGDSSTAGNVPAVIAEHGSFGFPVIVKPAGEGSSLGVSLARDELELESAVEAALRFDDEVLVERFIEGKEVSVGVLDGQALGAVEIVPRQPFYDFRSKHPTGRSDYHLPARLSPERYRSALRMAVMAHEALGCEGASRVDLIISDKGNEVILEVNTLPDMAPTSLLPKIAHAAGMSFDDLVEEILRGARLRAHGHRRDRRGVRLGFDGPERRAGFQSEAH